MINKNQIVEFENYAQYMVIDKLEQNGRVYVYLSRIDLDTDMPTAEAVIMKQHLEPDAVHLDEIDNDAEYEQIKQIFEHKIGII